MFLRYIPATPRSRSTRRRPPGEGVTFVGISLFSAFIGVLASSIDDRLPNLHEGRSRVLESDHTLILGWSESVFVLVAEQILSYMLAQISASRDLADDRLIVLAED